MKKKILALIIIMAIQINNFTLYANESKITIKVDTTINCYIEDEKNKLIDNLKNQSDKEIFDHALEPSNIRWFCDKYINDVHNAEIFKYEMERYLLSQKSVKAFIFIAAREIDEKILEMYSKILTDMNVTAEIKLKEREKTVYILAKQLPTAQGMVDEAFKNLVKVKLSSKDESKIFELYQEFRNKYRNTVISLEAFSVIAAYYISGGLLAPLLLSGGIIFIETKNISQKNELYVNLRQNLILIRNDFHKILTKTTTDIIDLMMNKLKLNIKFLIDNK